LFTSASPVFDPLLDISPVTFVLALEFIGSTLSRLVRSRSVFRHSEVLLPSFLTVIVLS